MCGKAFDIFLEGSMNPFVRTIILPIIRRTAQKLDSESFQIVSAVQPEFGSVVGLDHEWFTIFDE